MQLQVACGYECSSGKAARGSETAHSEEPHPVEVLKEKLHTTDTIAGPINWPDLLPLVSPKDTKSPQLHYSKSYSDAETVSKAFLSLTLGFTFH